MRKENKWLIGKYAMIIIMLSLLFIKKRDAQSIGMGIGIIIGIILITFFRFKHPEKYKSDERLEKLGSKATLWSWTATFVVVTLIYWLNYLGYINLNSTQVIGIIFWGMIITIMIFRWYFIRKPDVK
jgi:hypothetical protein